MEVAFETDPLTRPGDGDWTDITDAGEHSVLIKTLRTRRGARTMTGQLVPGSAAAHVDYPNRVLEPFYDGSPWYPNVDLRKRVRWLLNREVSGVSDGGDTDPEEDISDGGGAGDEDDVSDGGDLLAPVVLWTGFIEKLPNAWTMEVASVNVEAVGLLSLIANVKLPRSVFEAVLAELAPVGVWLLADSGGMQAAETIGNRAGAYTLTPKTISPGVVPWGSIASQVMTPPTATGPGQAITLDPLPVTGSRTLGLWVRIPGAGIHADVPLWYAAAGSNRWNVAVSDGRVRCQVDDGTEGVYISTESQGIDDGQPHLILVRIDTTADEVSMLIDGHTVEMLIDTTTGTPDYSTILSAVTTAKIGFDPAATALVGANTREYHLGPVMLFDGLLSDAEGAELWSAGVDAWDGDLTGARAHRVLDLAGVDPDDRDIATGTQVCGPAVLNEQTVAAYLKKVAQTEGGPMFETADCKIALRERIANNPTPDLVLSDDPDGDTGVPFLQPSLDHSTARLVNTANVTRPGNPSQPVADAASVQKYGEAPIEVDTLHGTATGALMVGARIVIRNKRPRLAVNAVSVDSYHWEEVPSAVSLGADIGDVAWLLARPPGGGDPIDQLLGLESVEQALSASSWVTSFGVFEHVVLPCFSWDTPGAGWDESVWCEGGA